MSSLAPPSTFDSMSFINVPALYLSQQPRSLSEAALEVCALFGIDAERFETASDHQTARDPLVDAFRLPLPVGGIVFVTGPSGSGKSSLLRHIEATLRDADACEPITVANDPRATGSVIDLPELALHEAFDVLAVAGLADAHDLLKTPAQLSEGQRWRYSLAFLLSRGMMRINTEPAEQHKRIVLFIDEFCSTLDRLTAFSIARTVGRWIRRTPFTLIAASAHDDIVQALQPTIVLHKPLLGPLDIRAHTSTPSHPA